MKIKHLMIVCLILAIVTIGAVSAADDVSLDNVTATDDVDIIAEDDSGDGDTPGEDEEEGELYIEEDWILVDYDTEVVGLETGAPRDTGRLVVFDNDTYEEYYNNTLANMTYNDHRMKYKANNYDGYYVFPGDLNVKSGVYNITAIYYNDDHTINQTVDGTVNIDKDSFINDDEIDITDNTTVIVSVYIFDWFEGGQIIIGYDDEDRMATVKTIDLTPADLGTVMNFTRSDLDLELGYYEGFFVGFLEADGDLDEDLLVIVEENVKIVDDSKFRAFIYEDVASILSDEELFLVYCPVGSEGTNITVYVNENPVITYSITENDTGDYYGFTLKQLGISEVGEYSFAVYDNSTGEVLADNYTYEFESPFEFSDICIIGTEDDLILELTVPLYFDYGRIELSDSDGMVFASDLADMEPVFSDQGPLFQAYQISINNLSKSYEPGICWFYACYSGNVTIDDNGYVMIAERKVAEKDNVTIEIFDYVVFDLNDIDDEDVVFIATVCADNNNGSVVVCIDDLTKTLDASEEYGNWIYVLTIDDIRDFEEGEYPINVTYYDKDGKEVLNLSSTIDVIRGKASAEIDEYNVIMEDGWNYTGFIEVRALYNFNGFVVITLAKDEDEVFVISLDDLVAVPDSNPLFYIYDIRFDDLNKTDFEPREYLVYIAIYDDDCEDDEGLVWDNGDGDIVSFFEPQKAENDNVTIEIIPSPVIIPDEPFIFITADDNSTNVTIIIENNDPISIALTDLFYDDVYGYVVSAVDLDLGVGEYNLNVTYQGLSLKGKVNLISNLVIDMPEDGEALYWGCDQDPVIAWFQLRNGDIKTDIVYGNVTVSVYLDGVNETVCFKKDISELEWHGGLAALVIRLSDLEGCSNLTGIYEIDVAYEGGTEAATDVDYSYYFKELAADDFSVDIVGDRIIFSIPDNVGGDVNVTIDGNSTVTDLWDLEWDEDEGVKYLEFEGLGTGTHKVSVAFIGKSGSSIELADTVVNPIDPALTISVTNIEEGNPAVVTITTNATFTGNVVVKIGNKEYNVAVANGKGTLSVPNLAAGNYVATAIFAATGDFAYSEKNATFTVTKKATPQPQKDKITLTLKKVKVKKSAKKLVLKATLKINGKAVKGKVIKFKFKGKTYKAKTNKKGVAKVTIKKKVLKKLKVGKKIKIQATYGKVTKKYTVKVKK